MKSQRPIQIIDSLLEINNDRVLVYSLVKNEIDYEDLKKTLDACIKNSLLCCSQLVEERNRIASKENYITITNEEFFNVWLTINECLSKHNQETIYSLFNESENVFKATYDKALNKDNIKLLSLRHKRLILRQKERLLVN